MEQKKDNSLLIRLSDEDMKKLNDGWFKAVTIKGRPVTKSEYLRDCISYMLQFLTQLEQNNETFPKEV